MKLAILIGAAVAVLVFGDLLLNDGHGARAIQQGFYSTMTRDL